MSQQVGSGVGIALGIALIATGIFAPVGAASLATVSWGTVLSGALMVAGGAYGLAFSQSTGNSAGVKARDLDFYPAAAEGQPVPVIFGTVKIGGNFLYSEKSQFKAEEIKGKRPSGGSGGSGGRPVVGYRYRWCFEMGLCCGPVDAIDQVWSNPGEIQMMEKWVAVANTGNNSTTTTTNLSQTTSVANVTVDVSSTANLSVNMGIIVGKYYRMQYTIAGISGNTLTLTPVTTPTKVGFNMPAGSAVYPKLPALNSNIRMAFDSTASMSANDELTIASLGKFKVVTVHNATSATLQYLEAANESFVTASKEVKKKVSPTVTFDGTPNVDFEELNLSSPSGNEGGTVRVYRGNASQTRSASGDPYQATFGLNYRSLCFALFMPNYSLGLQPGPKSYAFVIRRMPRVTLDDGTDLTLSGFKVRGSANTSHPSYLDANPAAVAYEILTNKLWGLGRSSNYLDTQSFITASQQFETNNIGVSFTVDTQIVGRELLDGLLSQVKSFLVLDGEKLKFRTLLFPQSQNYADIVTLTRSEIDNLELTRGDWSGLVTELRAEFVDRNRNYRPSSVNVQNLAVFNTAGGIANSERISLNAFTHQEIVIEQASRILHERSFPAALINFEVSRFACTLEPGDTFRLIWDESSATPVTGYFTVTSIAPGSSSNESIRVSAAEDIALGFAEGAEYAVPAPGPSPWDYLTDTAQTLNGLYAEPEPTIQSVYPIAAIEVPALVTRGKEAAVFITGEQSSGDLTNIVAKASTDGTTFSELGRKFSFSITGQMLTDWEEGPSIDRSPDGFQFSLTNPTKNEATVLAANLVPTDAADIEDLLAKQKHYMVFLDGEIVQVGLIEKLGTNQYRARHIVRGLFGSPIQPHYKHTDRPSWIFFLEDAPENFFNTDSLPDGQQVTFRAYPETPIRDVNVAEDVLIRRQDSAQDKQYLGIGKRPLAPEPYSATLSGSTYTIHVRPRFFDKGAGTNNFVECMKSLIADTGDMEFLIVPYGSAGTALADRATVTKVVPATVFGVETGAPIGTKPVTYEFIPDDYDDPQAGLVKIVYELPASISAANVKMIKVFSSLSSKASIESANFAF